ncbi:MAG: 4-hydroxybenzoate 3-monooxygenase [Vicinamibacterales bacterium]
MNRRAHVGIVGAGPAGLVLGHLLHRAGLDTVVVEHRSREYVQDRVRAGVLEQATVDLLHELGAGARLAREGMVHRGVELRFDGEGYRVDFEALTGRTITIYGQNEVLKDLIDLRLETGAPLVFEATDVAIDGFASGSPRVTFRDRGETHELSCDFIAGCDGSHGISRPSIPAGVLTVYEKTYPFAWLGILADAAPSSDELIYARHERGFALHSMRSPRVTRLYLQCAPDEDADAWSDRRIWDELGARLAKRSGFSLREGPIRQKGVTPMRSLVVEPMQYGRLFLAGDAAHIVPPTGAKGLNLAVADVHALARAIVAFYRDGREDLLEAYSDTCLRRVWQAQRFSWWMTTLLHTLPDADAFDRRRQLAELRQIASSRAAATTLAESYTGLPFDGGGP